MSVSMMKNVVTARPCGAASPAVRPAARSVRPSVAVRAEKAPGPAQEVSGVDTDVAGTIFYGGKTYDNDATWEAALRDGSAQMNSDVSTSGSSGVGAISIGDAMAFAGPAPEIINGRLAMLGFVAALGAELNTETSVVKQLSQEPTLISLTFILFIAGSLVPIISGKKDALGPFTESAELLNGRAAMIGFASLLIAEGIKGSPLF